MPVLMVMMVLSVGVGMFPVMVMDVGIFMMMCLVVMMSLIVMMLSMMVRVFPIMVMGVKFLMVTTVPVPLRIILAQCRVVVPVQIVHVVIVIGMRFIQHYVKITGIDPRLFYTADLDGIALHW